uniref:Uncharacterized protein n=1 Tax=Calcidiscus leptoporus TaxID=127549 RepID=A0A7S0J2M8_9EUKA|mmetsp:Transcript_35670/g.83228  ORF Transcript_35670/g.83228 Transcript_35670/m.83228 type:complete len:611 (+) Transcript_35670:123-1955(+)
MSAGDTTRLMQANLESVVEQLKQKTEEAEAAKRDAAKQKELVIQITKKLDSVSKRNKALEKENMRNAAARETRTESGVQTEPDAQLVAAEASAAEAAISIEAFSEKLRLATDELEGERGTTVSLRRELAERAAAHEQEMAERAGTHEQERAALVAQLAAAAEKERGLTSELAAQVDAQQISGGAQKELEGAVRLREAELAALNDQLLRHERAAVEGTKALAKLREETAAKSAVCETLTSDLADAAEREQELQALLHQTRSRMAQQEVGGDSAQQLARAQSALSQTEEEVREARRRAQQLKRDCHEHEQRQLRDEAELAARSGALRSLGAQLLKVRDHLETERQWSAQLQSQIEAMSGDANEYAQTIATLQQILRGVCVGASARSESTGTEVDVAAAQAAALGDNSMEWRKRIAAEPAEWQSAACGGLSAEAVGEPNDADDTPRTASTSSDAATTVEADGDGHATSAARAAAEADAAARLASAGSRLSGGGGESAASLARAHPSEGSTASARAERVAAAAVQPPDADEPYSASCSSCETRRGSEASAEKSKKIGELWRGGLRNMKESMLAISDGVKEGVREDAMTVVDSLGSVMRNVRANTQKKATAANGE